MMIPFVPLGMNLPPTLVSSTKRKWTPGFSVAFINCTVWMKRQLIFFILGQRVVIPDDRIDIASRCQLKKRNPARGQIPLSSSHHQLPQSPFRDQRGGKSSSTLRPIPQTSNLLRHQLGQRNKFGQDSGNIQVSRLLLQLRHQSQTPGKGPR